MTRVPPDRVSDLPQAAECVMRAAITAIVEQPLGVMAPMRPSARPSTTARALATACLLAVAPASEAALPPKYLSVEAFEVCLAEQPTGSYRAWCRPARKPEACPSPSWRQLRALKGRDAVPACAASTQGSPSR